MALEWDRQRLKARAQAALEAAKKNPALVVLAAGGVLALALLIVIIVTLFGRPQASQEKFDLAENEPNLCIRLAKLQSLEPVAQRRGQSKAYQTALEHIFEELAHARPTPNDLAVLSQLGCQGLSNEDLAWQLALETKIREGGWLEGLHQPPKAARVREALHQALERNPKLPLTFANSARPDDAWLAFIGEFAAVPEPIAVRVMGPDDSVAETTDLYQRMARLAPSSSLTRKLYEKLNLLARPIYVEDTRAKAAGESPGGASMPASAPATPVRGPGGTLLFLGVLEGDSCAVAMEQKPFPPLWVRPCQGLVPRRLPEGEPFLLAAETRREKSTRWVPLLLTDEQQVIIGDELRKKIDDKLLFSFVEAAPHFAPGPKGGLAPYRAPLGRAAPQDEENAGPIAHFTTTEKNPPPFIAFSAASEARAAKPCAKLDKARCDELRGSNAETKCDFGASACMLLPGGVGVRWTPVRLWFREPCLREMGERSDCRIDETWAMQIDVKKSPEAEYTARPLVVISGRREH